MLRVVSSFLLTEHADNLITACFGADHRSILPPFVPVGRGSDVIFGQLLKKIQPQASFGHLPWATLHLPLENRRFWKGEILRSAPSTDVRGMFCALLSGLSTNDSGEPALRAISRALIEMGSQPLPEFKALLVECRSASAKNEAAILEQRLQSLNLPTRSCAQDLEAYIRSLKENQFHPSSGIPAELLYGRHSEQALPGSPNCDALRARSRCMARHDPPCRQSRRFGMRLFGKDKSQIIDRSVAPFVAGKNTAKANPTKPNTQKSIQPCCSFTRPGRMRWKTGLYRFLTQLYRMHTLSRQCR